MQFLNFFTNANVISQITFFLIFCLLVFGLLKKNLTNVKSKYYSELTDEEKLEHDKKNRKVKILYFLFFVICCFFSYFLYTKQNSIKRNEFDIVNKENEKMIPLFSSAYNDEKKMYRGDQWSPGCKKTAPVRIDSFFSTIKEIETYSMYGLASSRLRNRILVKLIYVDGKTKIDIPTSNSWSGKYLGEYPLLLKFYLENGQIKKALSNGVEMNSSPDGTQNPLHNLIETLIKFDMDEHHSDYFLDTKTNSDLKKEWDSVK